MSISRTLGLLVIAVITIQSSLILAEKCLSEKFVYGRNEILDQLMLCSLAKSNDLHLTPKNGHTKVTSATLTDLGFSNKTNVVSASVSGLWSLKRAKFQDTAWKCNSNSTIMSAVIELNGIALDAIEKIDIPIHRSQKSMFHKPCKTLGLPISLCRHNRSIYKATRTWVNQVYLNLTLTQQVDSIKPFINDLWLMFTCPETFRQKITYSPSSSHILSRFAQISKPVNTPRINSRSFPSSSSPMNAGDVRISHPVSYTSTQDGSGPVSPPYHNSVRLITQLIKDHVRASVQECIDLIDSDLSLVAYDNSFKPDKFHGVSQPLKDEPTNKLDTINECSSKVWLRQRSEIAVAAHPGGNTPGFQTKPSQGSVKRSGAVLDYPSDLDQLLDPYGHYHDESAEVMVMTP